MASWEDVAISVAQVFAAVNLVVLPAVHRDSRFEGPKQGRKPHFAERLAVLLRESYLLRSAAANRSVFPGRSKQDSYVGIALRQVREQHLYAFSRKQEPGLNIERHLGYPPVSGWISKKDLG